MFEWIVHLSSGRLNALSHHQLLAKLLYCVIDYDEPRQGVIQCEI